MTAPEERQPRFGADGLVAAVVQDADTRRVLMVGYMNPEALQATLDSGLVHFWSRSRQTLWRKGETSGNLLHLVGVEVDCDGDALLVTVRPAGPTCHTGAVSCFSDPEGAQAGDEGFARLERLWSTIVRRREQLPGGSYTVTLLEGGPDLTGRKLVEEATELLLAAKDHAGGEGEELRVVEEAADLVYHLLVALAERGVPPGRVLEELDRRAG